MLTVKQLKEFLEKCDDDMVVVAVTNNYEQGHNYVDAYVTTGHYSPKMRGFRDDFDGTSYSSKIYEYNENGQKVVVIRG